MQKMKKLLTRAGKSSKIYALSVKQRQNSRRTLRSHPATVLTSAHVSIFNLPLIKVRFYVDAEYFAFFYFSEVICYSS